jgi:RecB family exonuclease
MARTDRLSASKITTYKGCPMAYFLKYVKHEKVPAGINLVFGKAVHRMLDLFYKKNYKSPESFANSFKYQWFRTCSGEDIRGRARDGLVVTEYPSSKNPLRIGSHIRPPTGDVDIPGLFFGYLYIGKKMMEDFYETYKNRPSPVIREKSFELDILGHPNAFGFRKKHKVVVIFDRIDIFQDMNGQWKATIGDYKTDKGDPSKKSFQIHRHPQFTLYSMAFRQLIQEGRLKGIIPDEIKEESAILYFHMRDGKIVPTYRDETDFDYARSLCDDVADGIACKRFTPFYGFHCNLCDYQVPCENYSHSHGGPRIIDLEGKIKEARVSDWEEDFQKFLREGRKQSSYLEPQIGQLELQFSIPKPKSSLFVPFAEIKSENQKQKKFRFPK